MKKKLLIIALILFAFTAACQKQAQENANATSTGNSEYAAGTFGYDVQFLKQYHKDLVVLSDESSQAQILILPQYQGRVMTSASGGVNGLSYGWVNHELIASGKPTEHMSAFGGEERLWLGPEGGQFSIFFKKGVEFKFDNWFVPKEFDTEAFTLVSHDSKEAKFEREMHLQNYSGTNFDLKINRNIRLLNKSEIENAVGVKIPADLQMVGFQSENTLTNTGTKAWDKKSGLLSIWVLSMLNAAENTTVAVPYNNDPSIKAKIVTDDYFGKVPADRLVIKNNYMLFKADAKYRSKIGISPQRVVPYIVSYDAKNNVLTIAQFSFNKGIAEYVNSLWKLQDNPFSGDAVNSYNDGPVDGKQMGKFYEIESSSPAAALAPGKSIMHIHRTIHLTGSKESLDIICKKLIGIGVDEVKL